MSLRSGWKRYKKKHRVLAGLQTFGLTETSRIGRNTKKIAGAIKKNPELVGAGIGLAFGAPMIGSAIGGAFRSPQFSPDSVGSQFSEFSMDQTPESLAPEGSPEAPASSGFSAGIDKKWLIIGAIAIVAIVLLMKPKSSS